MRPPYHQQAPRPTTASSAIFERTRTESEPSENNRRRTNLLDTQDCVEIEDIGLYLFACFIIVVILNNIYIRLPFTIYIKIF